MARKPRSAQGFDLNEAPGHLLRRAQQYAFDLYSQEVGGGELTPRQFAVLITVEQNEGLSQTELVRKTGIDRSTLADMISRLLKRNLLARQRTETDARANAVSITPEGRRALQSVLPNVAKAEERIMKTLPASMQSNFIKALHVISDAADAQEEAAAPRRPAKKAAKKKAAKKKAAKKKTAKKATKKAAKKSAKKTAKKTAKKAPKKKAARKSAKKAAPKKAAGKKAAKKAPKKKAAKKKAAKKRPAAKA